MNSIGFTLLACLMLSGCAGLRTPEKTPSVRPPQAGLIRQVNQPEHYIIFEIERQIPPGTGLRLLRNGRNIGSAKVLPLRQKKFQVADILSGAPIVGDFCEPIITQLPKLETQPGK